jgi:predicted alpha/beta hydrolase family esterase
MDRLAAHNYNEMLEATHLKREKVYVTHSLGCLKA